jgi:hypothetical protein
MAKIQRGLIQGQLRGRCPKLELVTVTVAAMAVVATDRHVHRERAATSRRGLMQRTNSVPLYPRSLRGLEPKQAQNLLHRDLSANSVEKAEAGQVRYWQYGQAEKSPDLAISELSRFLGTVPLPRNCPASSNRWQKYLREARHITGSGEIGEQATRASLSRDDSRQSATEAEP